MVMLRTREACAKLVAQLVVANNFGVRLFLLMGHVMTECGDDGR